MNWGTSGIVHSFSYQLVDARDLTTAKGWLDGVTGGSITETYRGDNRSSCSLDLNGASIPWGCAVRVWHDASYDGENVHEMLGTFQPEPMDNQYRFGRESGSVDLYSSIKKLSTIYSSAITGVGKVNVIQHFKDVVSNAMGVPWVQPDWKTSATFGKAYTWVRPRESNRDECQRCADALGGYISVDERGRVTLKPYVLPSKLPSTWTLENVTLEGVDVDVPDIVNRVVAYHEENVNGKTKTYAQMAELPASSPYYKWTIGRHETITLNPSTIQPNADINAQLLKLAQQELAAHQGKNTYSCTAMYDPTVKCGTAGRLVYQDANAPGIDAQVFCSEREIKLDHTALMTLTLEQLR